MKKGITDTKKISDSHQSVINAAIPIIQELKKENYIDKIVIGKIRNVSSKIVKLISLKTNTSVRLTVKSRGEIQEFYIIGSNLDRIDKKVQRMKIA